MEWLHVMRFNNSPLWNSLPHPGFWWTRCCLGRFLANPQQSHQEPNCKPLRRSKSFMWVTIHTWHMNNNLRSMQKKQNKGDIWSINIKSSRFNVMLWFAEHGFEGWFVASEDVFQSRMTYIAQWFSGPWPVRWPLGISSFWCGNQILRNHRTGG